MLSAFLKGSCLQSSKGFRGCFLLKTVRKKTSKKSNPAKPSFARLCEGRAKAVEDSRTLWPWPF